MFRWTISRPKNCTRWKDQHERRSKKYLNSSGAHISVNHTKTRYNRRVPLTPRVRAFLDRIKAVQSVYYPDTPFLFPNEEGTDCIKKNAAYKVLNRICSNCGIKLDTTAKKGTSAFRKTYSSKTYYAGGAEFESIVQGHSPDVAKKHYLDNDGLDMDEAVKILDAIGL